MLFGIFPYTDRANRPKPTRIRGRREQVWRFLSPDCILSATPVHINKVIALLSVQDRTIDTAIVSARFACDLQKCRGACCTMPGPKGAPLLEKEILEIETAFPVIKKYLGEEHLQTIDERGLVERSGNAITTTCHEYRACVFVTYEQGIAKCAFEKAYWNKEITWRKPLSCHLFPIRIDRGFLDHLRYESIPECSAAVTRGRSENVFLSDFLKDPLIRLYGPAWYAEFASTCETQRQSAGVTRTT